jgi:hypothetical protein
MYFFVLRKPLKWAINFLGCVHSLNRLGLFPQSEGFDLRACPFDKLGGQSLSQRPRFKRGSSTKRGDGLLGQVAALPDAGDGADSFGLVQGREAIEE